MLHHMNYRELDTPALLIDREILINNLDSMQKYADENHVRLRPHTKTHKSPFLADMQVSRGALGIAAAKVGEAEVMAENGFSDIFIANEIVGKRKLERVASLSQKIQISFGVDCAEYIPQIEQVFAESNSTANILVEIEVGENRSGVIHEEDFVSILQAVSRQPHVEFRGIFSHDGSSYAADNLEECRKIAYEAQKRTLHFAEIAKQNHMPCQIVSYGATPTLMNHVRILEGITELRPGTYALMDASQANAVGTLDFCAATVLATVISKPTDERTILDVGAKGLTMQKRSSGICSSPGMGTLIDFPNTYIDSMFDEHAIIYNRKFHDQVRIGDKVRIIPVHICPVCNLFDTAYFISGDEVVEEFPVSCRGKLQ